MRNLARRRNDISIKNNLFDDFMTSNLDAVFRRLWNDAFADRSKVIDVFDNSVKYPKADARETTNGIEIDLAVPGCEKEDIDILFENGTITVKHDKTIQKESSNTSNVLFSELRRSSWSRSWNVNSDVIEEEISASLKNGILTVYIPLARPEIKNEPSPRKITISDSTDNNKIGNDNDVGNDNKKT